MSKLKNSWRNFMIIDKKNYILFRTLFENGIIAGYTKKAIHYMSPFSSQFEKRVERIKVELSLDKKSTIFSRQVHGDKIKALNLGDSITKYEGYDGFITDRDDVMIITAHADCLPIYITDNEYKNIGLIHSGWKGSQKKIILKAISKFENRYGVSRQNIKIFLGIGIKSCCYEVQNDFIKKFEQTEKNIFKNSFIKRGSRWYFDNESFIYFSLLNYGLSERNIERTGICNKCYGRYFSHRNGDEERNVAFISKNKNKCKIEGVL